MDVVASVEVPFTWNLCVPRLTSDVAPVYGIYVAVTNDVEAKVDEAYANDGKVLEAYE